MLRVVYLYDVVPGQAAEAKQWARKQWIPFWLAQPEVSNYEVFTNYFGPQGGTPIGRPQRMVSFDIESMAGLDRVMALPEFQGLASTLQKYAINVDFMVFRISYPPQS